jgi:hypothetical protein
MPVPKFYAFVNFMFSAFNCFLIYHFELLLPPSPSGTCKLISAATTVATSAAAAAAAACIEVYAVSPPILQVVQDAPKFV